ncbi:glutaminyl-peptide cyclotransferase [Salininema proteolyticum]|uniref:Glutaminyl-peptide cyclotransferase n=1 Tax=Salininema proteolyticum TaxID=1607685 RepID=A0ABV8TV95_9ACTN
MASRVALSATAALAMAVAACGSGNGADLEGVDRLVPEILETRPHDESAFTQGLEFSDGRLYESTGKYGRSEVRIVDPETGEVLASEALPDDEFGEGLTVSGDSLWQLTWQSGTVYQRDPETLEVRDTWENDREGWGICAAGDELFLSDGSDVIQVRDAEDFTVQREFEVTADGEGVDMINELECAEGRIWANLWQSADIIAIDPSDGTVESAVDASSLEGDHSDRSERTLNGIAAAGDGTYLLTGKEWPMAQLVRFTPAP